MRLVADGGVVSAPDPPPSSRLSEGAARRCRPGNRRLRESWPMALISTALKPLAAVSSSTVDRSAALRQQRVPQRATEDRERPAVGVDQ